jgi:hypothetical protein
MKELGTGICFLLYPLNAACAQIKSRLCMFVDEPETRDVWWAELRTEIRSHMRAMGCHAVIGYSEQTSIRDELIILSAIGTAATIRCQTAVCGGRIRQLSGTGQQANGVTSLVERLASIDETPSANNRRLHVDVSLANDAAGACPSTGWSVQVY